eukprot:gene5533-6219_t
MIKARKRLYKKYKSDNDQAIKKKHDKLSHKIKEQLKSKFNEYINGILEENIKSKPKKFWRFIKSKRNEDMGVSPLINSNGKLVTDSKGKADVLNKQYQSVFTQEKVDKLPDVGESSIPSISDITFTIPGIEKLLKGLDTNKSNGPDEIPLRILKEYASEIAPMLTFIMQQSYDTGTLPDDWKNANVVALFKKGDRSKAENYRPVSLTAVTYSLTDAEKLVNDLQSLVKWSETWQMAFNVTKCHILKVCKKKNPTDFQYTMNNIPVSEVDRHPYLGVELEQNMSWSQHITATANKASSTLGFLRRNLSACSTQVKATAYKTLVRPKLEYASSVWDPHHRNKMEQLEKVQRKAARWAMNQHSWATSVSHLQRQLEWPALHQRRLYARLVLMFKIKNNDIAIPLPSYIMMPTANNAIN